MFRREFSVIVTALALTACSAPVPKFQSAVPDAGKSTYAMASAPALATTSSTIQHLDNDKTIVYQQNYGGGGAGLGLLLGPIGVAANASMIESMTKSDAEKMREKILVKPRNVFESAARKKGVQLDNVTDARITPYLYVSKTENDRLLVASAMIVEQAAWSGKYMYQLPVTYSVDELAGLDGNATVQLQNAVEGGFEALLQQMQAESAASEASEKPITFKSDFVTPRFGFDMYGSLVGTDNDVVWVRTVGAVYGLRKSNVSYSPR